jgi:CO/xanthine dehydrogenase Mo-binding subunit
MDASGKFTGMKVTTTANVGAYLSTFASSVPTILYATLLAGQYTTPVIYLALDRINRKIEAAVPPDESGTPSSPTAGATEGIS